MEVSLVCVDGIKDNQITIPWPSSLQILCHLLGVGTWDSQVSQLQIRPDHGRLGNFPQQCHTIIDMEISIDQQPLIFNKNIITYLH